MAHLNVMTTRLVTKNIPSCADAAMLMGANDRVGNEKRTPMVLVPNRNSCKLWVVIPEGFHALMTSHGRFIGIWKPGFHMARPWERVSHLVTMQYVVFDSPVKECPTMDNVMVEIDVSVVFHVKDTELDVENFVYKLGPERLDAMLKAYQEEAVRDMARHKKYSNIYDLMDTDELMLPQGNDMGAEAGELQAEGTNMDDEGVEMAKLGEVVDSHNFELSKQLENTKRQMNDRLGIYGIFIKDVTITNVILPPTFRVQMEEATTFESRNIKLAAEQEYNILCIEDKERRNQAKQRLGEEKAEAVSKNKQRMAEENKVTDLFKAGTSALVADIEEKMDADVREIKVNSELRVAQLTKAKDLELSSIAAEAEAEVATIKSEMTSYVLTHEAEAQVRIAECNASALALIAKAEDIAATKLKAKRDFEAKMAQLRILKNLASNGQVSLSTTNTDSVIAQMVAAKDASISLGLQ